MAKRRIAHIITHLEPGGAQKTTLSLLSHIDKREYEVYLFTSSGGLLTDDAFSIPDIRIFLIPTLVRAVNPLFDLISLFGLIVYLKKEKISLVHTHSSKAGIIGRWAAWCAGVHSIFHTVHGWPFYIESNNLVRFFYLLLEKLTSWITTKIIVVSEADLKAGLHYVNKNRAQYIRVSYGIESSQFFVNGYRDENKRISRLRELDIKEGSCVVGFVACFKPQKAPLDFVKVAKAVIDRNEKVQFLSIGDGLLRPRAENFSRRLNLNGRIKFLGWRKDMPALFSVIDILLLTSRWEGLPVVFLEAMASGVPIVATDVGGTSEVVTNGVNGFVEEKGDCEKLAEDILFLAENHGRRIKFSECARREFKEEFNISYMTKEIQNLYQRR